MTKEQLFFLNPDSKLTLQEQLQHLMIDAILNGYFKTDKPLPSCRKLAKNIGVSKNTVILVYEHLVSEDYLISRERVGYFINKEILDQKVATKQLVPFEGGSKTNWRSRYKKFPSILTDVPRPVDWQSFTYPFIYGQPDPTLFPLHEWFKCSKEANELSSAKDWLVDSYSQDDPMLIEEIKTGLLPRRGIHASSDEILLTMGVQHALYLIGSLFFDPATQIGIEDPSYVDARNIFRIHNPELNPLPVDDSGLIIDGKIDSCDFIYITPSHQYPTTVTMPLTNRLNLLKKASASDFVVIEDDYENEVNHLSRSTPAIKSLDKADRVIYVSSLSKSLAPGLRIGYMVGPKEMIKEARALRKLMLRHPPANVQRTLALFIARGKYGSFIRKAQREYKQRWEVMHEAITQHLPFCSFTPTTGGSAFWMRGPKNLNSKELELEAAKKSVVLEAGNWFYFSKKPPSNCFRLGFTSIKTELITPGIQRIAQVIQNIT